MASQGPVNIASSDSLLKDLTTFEPLKLDTERSCFSTKRKVQVVACRSLPFLILAGLATLVSSFLLPPLGFALVAAGSFTLGTVASVYLCHKALCERKVRHVGIQPYINHNKVSPSQRNTLPINHSTQPAPAPGGLTPSTGNHRETPVQPQPVPMRDSTSPSANEPAPTPRAVQIPTGKEPGPDGPPGLSSDDEALLIQDELSNEQPEPTSPDNTDSSSDSGFSRPATPSSSGVPDDLSDAYNASPLSISPAHSVNEDRIITTPGSSSPGRPDTPENISDNRETSSVHGDNPYSVPPLQEHRRAGIPETEDSNALFQPEDVNPGAFSATDIETPPLGPRSAAEVSRIIINQQPARQTTPIHSLSDESAISAPRRSTSDRDSSHQPSPAVIPESTDDEDEGISQGPASGSIESPSSDEESTRQNSPVLTDNLAETEGEHINPEPVSGSLPRSFRPIPIQKEIDLSAIQKEIDLSAIQKEIDLSAIEEDAASFQSETPTSVEQTSPAFSRFPGENSEAVSVASQTSGTLNNYIADQSTGYISLPQELSDGETTFQSPEVVATEFSDNNSRDFTMTPSSGGIRDAALNQEAFESIEADDVNGASVTTPVSTPIAPSNTQGLLEIQRPLKATVRPAQPLPTKHSAPDSTHRLMDTRKHTLSNLPSRVTDRADPGPEAHPPARPLSKDSDLRLVTQQQPMPTSSFADSAGNGSITPHQGAGNMTQRDLRPQFTPAAEERSSIAVSDVSGLNPVNENALFMEATLESQGDKIHVVLGNNTDHQSLQTSGNKPQLFLKVEEVTNRAAISPVSVSGAREPVNLRLTLLVQNRPDTPQRVTEFKISVTRNDLAALLTPHTTSASPLRLVFKRNQLSDLNRKHPTLIASSTQPLSIQAAETPESAAPSRALGTSNNYIADQSTGHTFLPQELSVGEIPLQSPEAVATDLSDNDSRDFTMTPSSEGTRDTALNQEAFKSIEADVVNGASATTSDSPFGSLREIALPARAEDATSFQSETPTSHEQTSPDFSLFSGENSETMYQASYSPGKAHIHSDDQHIRPPKSPRQAPEESATHSLEHTIFEEESPQPFFPALTNDLTAGEGEQITPEHAPSSYTLPKSPVQSLRDSDSSETEEDTPPVQPERTVSIEQTRSGPNLSPDENKNDDAAPLVSQTSGTVSSYQSGHMPSSDSSPVKMGETSAEAFNKRKIEIAEVGGQGSIRDFLNANFFYTPKEPIGKGSHSSVHRVTSTKDDDDTEFAIKIKKRHRNVPFGKSELSPFLIQNKGLPIPETYFGVIRHKQKKHLESIYSMEDFEKKSKDFDLEAVALEYIDGKDFGTYLEEFESLGKTMTENEMLGYAVEVCRGVKLINENGLIHRDLKPNNLIRVEKEGKAEFKFIDFGTSVLVSEAKIDTNNGIDGTEGYISPEAYNTHKWPDIKDDSWAVGAILCFLACGKTPNQLFHQHDGSTPEYSVTDTIGFAELSPEKKEEILRKEIKIPVTTWIEKYIKTIIDLTDQDPDNRATAADAYKQLSVMPDSHTLSESPALSLRDTPLSTTEEDNTSVQPERPVSIEQTRSGSNLFPDENENDGAAPLVSQTSDTVSSYSADQSTGHTSLSQEEPSDGEVPLQSPEYEKTHETNSQKEKAAAASTAETSLLNSEAAANASIRLVSIEHQSNLSVPESSSLSDRDEETFTASLPYVSDDMNAAEVTGPEFLEKQIEQHNLRKPSLSDEEKAGLISGKQATESDDSYEFASCKEEEVNLREHFENSGLLATEATALSNRIDSDEILNGYLENDREDLERPSLSGESLKGQISRDIVGKILDLRLQYDKEPVLKTGFPTAPDLTGLSHNDPEVVKFVCKDPFEKLDQFLTSAGVQTDSRKNKLKEIILAFSQQSGFALHYQIGTLVADNYCDQLKGQFGPDNPLARVYNSEELKSALSPEEERIAYKLTPDPEKKSAYAELKIGKGDTHISIRKVYEYPLELVKMSNLQVSGPPKKVRIVAHYKLGLRSDEGNNIELITVAEVTDNDKTSDAKYSTPVILYDTRSATDAKAPVGAQKEDQIFEDGDSNLVTHDHDDQGSVSTDSNDPLQSSDVSSSSGVEDTKIQTWQTTLPASATPSVLTVECSVSEERLKKIKSHQATATGGKGKSKNKPKSAKTLRKGKEPATEPATREKIAPIFGKLFSYYLGLSNQKIKVSNLTWKKTNPYRDRKQTKLKVDFPERFLKDNQTFCQACEPATVVRSMINDIQSLDENIQWGILSWGIEFDNFKQDIEENIKQGNITTPDIKPHNRVRVIRLAAYDAYENFLKQCNSEHKTRKEEKGKNENKENEEKTLPERTNFDYIIKIAKLRIEIEKCGLMLEYYEANPQKELTEEGKTELTQIQERLLELQSKANEELAAAESDEFLKKAAMNAFEANLEENSTNSSSNTYKSKPLHRMIVRVKQQLHTYSQEDTPENNTITRDSTNDPQKAEALNQCNFSGANVHLPNVESEITHRPESLSESHNQMTSQLTDDEIKNISRAFDSLQSYFSQAGGIYDQEAMEEAINKLRNNELQILNNSTEYQKLATLWNGYCQSAVVFFEIVMKSDLNSKELKEDIKKYQENVATADSLDNETGKYHDQLCAKQKNTLTQFFTSKEKTKKESEEKLQQGLDKIEKTKQVRSVIEKNINNIWNHIEKSNTEIINTLNQHHEKITKIIHSNEKLREKINPKTELGVPSRQFTFHKSISETYPFNHFAYLIEGSLDKVKKAK